MARPTTPDKATAQSFKGGRLFFPVLCCDCMSEFSESMRSPPPVTAVHASCRKAGHRQTGLKLSPVLSKKAETAFKVLHLEECREGAPAHHADARFIALSDTTGSLAAG